MCLNSDVSAASGIDRMKVLQVDLGRILHAEQAFDYHRMAYAGDTLHFDTTVSDVYDKKGGRAASCRQHHPRDQPGRRTCRRHAQHPGGTPRLIAHKENRTMQAPVSPT